LIAYAQGLEGCQIDVEVSQGIVMLTGHASCDAAVDKAIGIAADFSSMPVNSTIDVQETCLATPLRTVSQPLKDRPSLGKILYMKRDLI
jgi:FixJ family two-component response regulator